MSAPASLSEAWDERAAEKGRHAHKVPPLVQERRAFYAGALAAAALPRDQVLRECIDFARAIGTPAESAKP